MGGSSKSETKLPQYVQDADKANMVRAAETAKIGYTPYYGPDVAAFTPQQIAAFQNTNQSANAFGMQTPTELGIPQAQQFEGGIMGYSSGGMYDQAIGELERKNPGQIAAIRSLFIDPVTGAPPTNKALLDIIAEVNASSGVMGAAQGGSFVDNNYNGDYNAHIDKVLADRVQAERERSDRDYSSRAGSGDWSSGSTNAWSGSMYS